MHAETGMTNGLDRAHDSAFTWVTYFLIFPHELTTFSLGRALERGCLGECWSVQQSQMLFGLTAHRFVILRQRDILRPNRRQRGDIPLAAKFHPLVDWWGLRAHGRLERGSHFAACAAPTSVLSYCLLRFASLVGIPQLKNSLFRNPPLNFTAAPQQHETGVQQCKKQTAFK